MAAYLSAMHNAVDPAWLFWDSSLECYWMVCMN